MFKFVTRKCSLNVITHKYSRHQRLRHFCFRMMV